MSKVSKQTSAFIRSTFIAGIFAGTSVFCIGAYLFFSFDLSANFCGGLIIFSFLTMVGLPIFLINKHNKAVEEKYRGINIVNIDALTGVEFEQYLKRVLTYQGYSVNTTDVTGDLGVDLIAAGKGDKIAIQVKRYSTKVSRRAISDAVAGMYHYGCNKAMVITNNYFSPGAIALAESTDCILIDRDILANWVNEFQASENALTQKP